jgi:invasion protein IalB
MRVAERTIACGLAAAFLLTLAGAAAAQQPTPPKPAPPRPAPAQHPAPPPATQGQAAPATPAAPVDQTPQRTTASYGDWVVRCETTPGPPPQKNCDMEQLAQVQGQAQPISRVAIPLPPKGEPAKLFIQLPINVSFMVPVKIVADGKDAGTTTPFRRCVPAGCFAELELKDDLQKKFRAAATEPGKILFKDAADRDVTIPLSFKGFAQAFEALLKQ